MYISNNYINYGKYFNKYNSLKFKYITNTVNTLYLHIRVYIYKKIYLFETQIFIGI